MSKKVMVGSDGFWGFLTKLYDDSKQVLKRPAQSDDDRSNDMRPPIRFITLESYSTYVTKIRPIDTYSDRSPGTEYAMRVDGDKPVSVDLTRWDGDGNHKQLISFIGDSINGEVTLMLDGENRTDQP